MIENIEQHLLLLIIGCGAVMGILASFESDEQKKQTLMLDVLSCYLFVIAMSVV